MGGGAGGDTYPAWEPHANRYVYVAWRYPITSCLATGQQFSQLMLARPSGGSGVALTGPGHRVLQPSWSPNGRLITFVLGQPGAVERVVVARLSGKGLSAHLSDERTIATGHIADPAFSPDGKWVSYLRANGDGFIAEMQPVDGGSERSITGVPSDVDARWTPVWVR